MGCDSPAASASVPRSKKIHLIIDNLQTHKHPNVKRWLARHQRFHIHFTPTSSSWLNMVERFFRDLTENAIRRGTFKNVDAIGDYLSKYNEAPKPFVWTPRPATSSRRSCGLARR